MIFLVLLVVVLSIGLGFAIWYIINCLRKIQFMVHSIEDLDIAFQDFEQHLKHVYSLDMYYGDQTLEHLIMHTKELHGSFTEFRKDYDVFTGDIDETDFSKEEDNTAEESDPREDLLLKGP